MFSYTKMSQSASDFWHGFIYYYWSFYELVVDKPWNFVYFYWSGVYYKYIIPYLFNQPVLLGYDQRRLFHKYYVPDLWWAPHVTANDDFNFLVNYGKKNRRTRLEIEVFGYHQLVFPMTRADRRRRIFTLRKLSYPQLVHNHPRTQRRFVRIFVGNWRKLQKEERRKQVALDPNDNTIVAYKKTFKFLNFELLRYNIQMEIKLFNLFTIDLIELCCLFIVSLICLLVLAIKYYKSKGYNLVINAAKQIERREIEEEEKPGVFLDYDHFLSKKEAGFKYDEEYGNYKGRDMTKLSFLEYYMRNSREVFVGNKFHYGLTLRTLSIEIAQIGMYLFVIGTLGLIFNYFLGLYMYYIHNFYLLNEYFFTYIFFYVFSISSYIFWKLHLRYEWLGFRRGEEYDYTTYRMFSHMCRVLGLLNFVKLVNDVDIHVYVILYLSAIVYMYFGCDSCDWFQGWNQPYSLDVRWWIKNGTNPYEARRGIWFRDEYNRTWEQFIYVICMPVHYFIVRWVMLFFTPIYLFFYLPIFYGVNEKYIRIRNYLLFWKPPKYTIKELDMIWRRDFYLNCIYVQRNKPARSTWNWKGPKITFA